VVSTDVLENNQWTVDTADGVVPYPWLDRHHSGIHDVRHDGGGAARLGIRMSLVRRVCMEAADSEGSGERGL
jgi:hypothetical protein